MNVAVGEELEFGNLVGVAPGNRAARGNAVYARQFGNPTDRSLIEVEHLVGFLAVRHHGNVDGQDVAGIESGLRGLERDQSLEQHRGAGQQHEGRGDLRDREHALATIGAAGDARAAAGQSESMRGIGGGQARNEGQQDRGDEGQTGAHPQHARIDLKVEGAHRKTGRVAGQDGDHRLRAENSQRGAGSAQ